MVEKLRNRKGFSLVELIVVIAILGVISAIAIPAVLNTLQESKVKADITTAQSIIKAISLAIVSANSDTDDDNDIGEITTAISLEDLAGTTTDGSAKNLANELSKTYPDLANMRPQSDKTADFEVEITAVDVFKGSVTFEANSVTYTINESGTVTTGDGD